VNGWASSPSAGLRGIKLTGQFYRTKLFGRVLSTHHDWRGLLFSPWFLCKSFLKWQWPPTSPSLKTSSRNLFKIKKGCSISSSHQSSFVSGFTGDTSLFSPLGKFSLNFSSSWFDTCWTRMLNFNFSLLINHLLTNISSMHEIQFYFHHGKAPWATELTGVFHAKPVLYPDLKGAQCI